ncbi:hypothetical protein NMY22_g10783 [Coprinellus aureogranulatus]|nr:hypothetical protein NMY22_g10783 [Coprinellus aureogranulatus]
MNSGDSVPLGSQILGYDYEAVEIQGVFSDTSMNKLTGYDSALNSTITHDVTALLPAVYDCDIVTRWRVDLNVLPVLKSTRETVGAVTQAPV